MSDFGEAFGTAVEGGLWARAFGGKKGALTDKDGHPLEKGHFAEGDCLNCGTTLQGAHCHSCGQKAHLHRTIGAFLHDLLHGALHLDGKTWRTLPKLIFKPGELTRRYVEGERARFVSPMAMFLFSVFLMFAVFQIVGLTAPTDIQGDTTAQIRAEVQRLQERQQELNASLAGTELEQDERAAMEAELGRLDKQLEGIREAEAEVPFLKNITGNNTDTAETPDGENDTVQGSEADVTEEGQEAKIVTLENADLGELKKAGSGVEWVDNAIDKWRTNPGLMLYKLQANGYKFSWLLIPLSIPFVWIMFAWKRRFKAYDHAIFVTYSLSFMSLLFIALSILGMVGGFGGWAFALLAIIPPIHIYKHLRGAYELSRFSALWRLAVMLVSVGVILILFLQLLLLLGAF